VTTFLRLFEAYRAMESLVLSTTHERNRLEQELERAHQRNDNLLARIDTAHESEVTAHKMVADFVAKNLAGRGVFDTVIELPVPPKDMKPIQMGKPHASALVAQAEREFMEGLNQTPHQPGPRN
jgi:hypothetical protein